MERLSLHSAPLAAQTSDRLQVAVQAPAQQGSAEAGHCCPCSAGAVLPA